MNHVSLRVNLSLLIHSDDICGPYPNAWLQDKVITLLLVYAALPLDSPKHSQSHTRVCVCARTHKQRASFRHPCGITQTVHSCSPEIKCLFIRKQEVDTHDNPNTVA